jgi:Transposase protein
LLCIFLGKQKDDKGKWNVSRWSDSSILNGIKMKFKCGFTGYQEHLDEGQPLPSIRCLQERTENFKCSPGIDHGTLEILKRRLANVECNADRDLVLFNDEMTLAKGRQYDSSTGNVVGDSTLPMHSGIGSKGTCAHK